MPIITQSGSRQYVVKPGQKFIVDRLTAPVGEIISLPVLLAFGDDKEISTLQAKVVEHKKGKKIIIFKFKNKSNYKRKNGFRTYDTVLQAL